MSVSDEIKNRLDIVDVISDYMPLRKSGASYSGFCPFHPNTRTPAFAVFPNSQTWRCFGACAEGGDVFSFVMKKEGWDFKEALVHLAAKAGVELEPVTATNRAQQAVEDRLSDLLTAAADYFHQLLLYAPQAEQARAYVTGRGLNDETQETFKIGFALESWDACRNHFNMQGYSDEDLTDAGLLTTHEERGTSYDRFRNRLMIPIRDVGGRIVGFGARTLDPDGLPKYLNSPQTAVFDKSHLLFSLDLAKRDIRDARQVVIVEGYMDVMQAWQAGYRNVVAQMGTALTESQLRLLKRYTKRFILALDADAAGAQATLRGLEVAREALDREMDTRFDAPNLVRNEGRLQADIRIVTLPPGNDPDKIIRADPAQWPELVARARPVVEYVIEVVTADLDMNDGKAKTAAAQQVLPLINDVVDPVEREHYIQLLARTLGIDERVLHKMPAVSQRRRARPAGSDEAAAAPATNGPQPGRDRRTVGLSTAIDGQYMATEMRRSNYLCQCLSYPQLLQQVDNRLAQNQLAAVGEKDFTRPEDQLLLAFLQQHADRWAVAAIDDLCDSLKDEILCARVQSLLALPKTPESELDRLPDKLFLSVLDWRLEEVRGLVYEVKQLVDEAKKLEDPELLAMYFQRVGELTRQQYQLERARDGASSLGRQASGPPLPRS
jgi:DNA primase